MWERERRISGRGIWDSKEWSLWVLCHNLHPRHQQKTSRVSVQTVYQRLGIHATPVTSDPTTSIVLTCDWLSWRWPTGDVWLRRNTSGWAQLSLTGAGHWRARQVCKLRKYSASYDWHLHCHHRWVRGSTGTCWGQNETNWNSGSQDKWIK